jgi:GMP synthase (glutamine-hydrolysing)
VKNTGNTEYDKIAILDCGGQYTKVIDRKVRECFVKSDIFPLKTKAEELLSYRGIIISGGPESVWSDTSLGYDKNIFSLGIPVLGICYGMHLINTNFGGIVKPGVKNEYGETSIKIDQNCPLFAGCENEETVLMSHGDSIESLAPGFFKSAESGHIVASMYSDTLKIYGVQFHPEVDLTVNGKKMLQNFLFSVCGLSGNYKLEDRIKTAIEKIREKVKDGNVLVLVSGGVDSAVSAALLLKALDRNKIFGIHIDHGFMRKDESDQICETLKKLGLKNLIRVNAEDLFFNTTCELNGRSIGPLTITVDPEEKRNIIGHLFIEALRQQTEKLNLDPDSTFIAQGTLRPDLIESGNPDVSIYAHKIKTHHNDVEIIRRAREKGLIIETNWDWHKDEVRQVARNLGIDEAIASRQPFPGPGLAIRLICNKNDKIIREEEKIEFDRLLSGYDGEYRGIVVPINTVGVQGDCRSYRYLAVLASDKKTLGSPEPYKIGTYIPNTLNYINRVTMVIGTEDHLAGIITYPMFITKENVGLLREVDAMVRDSLDKKPINQVFAVLLPIGVTKKYSVAIRTFITNDFMTGRPAIIGKDVDTAVVQALVKKIEDRFEQIDLILYDVTSKPPATVEWE